MLRHLLSRPSLLLSLVALAGLIGCGGGGETGPARFVVSGKLTNGGQPLANVIVSFESADGHSAIATTDSEGKYSLDAVEGSHVVMLSLDNSAAAGDPDAPGGDDAPDGAYGADPSEGDGADLIPAEWTTTETSPKTVEVSATGENAIDIAIDAP